MEKETLVELVRQNLSNRSMSRQLGVSENTVRYWLKRYGLPTAKRTRWEDEERLAEAVRTSTSKAEVLRKIGVNCRKAGNYDTLNKHIKRLSLDTSHFLGRGGGAIRRKIPLSEVLVRNSTYARKHLKKRLLEKRLIENRCAVCGLGTEWNGKDLVLVLDHINGEPDDHRIENLRMLCPNCNSQTATFVGKRKKKNVEVVEMV